MSKIITTLVLAASVLAGIGAAQAGPGTNPNAYNAPGGLYSPFDR